MKGRVILLGEFNAHSPHWNFHCGERRNMAGLKALIDGYSLIVNSEPGQATRLTRGSKTSIIDFTFTTLEVGALDT